MTTDNNQVLKTTTQICALITIVGVGSPLQLLAKIFSIKPDKEVAEEKRLAKLETGSALATNDNDDGFVKAEADQPGPDDNQGSDLDFNMCENENDALNLINQSFDDLIKEKTYPWIITKFKDFDKYYMMPIFKRRTDLSASQMSKSEFTDKKFGFTTADSHSAFN